MKLRACLIWLALLAAGCNQSEPVPGMEQLPKELAPFARRIADSKLAHVSVTPVKGKTQPWDSKLRGVPYYPKDRQWPVDRDGKPLVMLVQINFAEMPRLEGYPSQGILQLYISAGYDPEKQMWGMCSEDDSFACLIDQSNFRAIYFPDGSFTTDQLISETPTVEYDEDYGFPAEHEAKLQFTLASSYVRPEDYRFRRVFGEDRSEFFDRRNSRSDLENAYERFMGGRRYVARIGGYSRVEQMDPRLNYADEEWLLLFSLDSVGDGDYPVGWGSGGIGNFYIRAQDLAKLDFGKVMYYWDFG